MSCNLERWYMKDANIFHGKMSDFIHMITESQNIKEIPWKLEQLSKLPAFEIHSFNNISNTLLKETIVAQSIEVLEYTFEVSDKPLIQELFASIEDQSNVSIISLVYKTESFSFVVATSVFAMCDEGCYVSYIAVIERDVVQVTEGGTFWGCGIASLLIRVIQLVCFEKYNCWHVFCWSNNKKKKKDLWYKLGFKVLHLVNNSYWPKKIEDFALLFHLPREHAMNSKLTAKGIFSTISSFDVPREIQSDLDLNSDSHILTLHYYKDRWFDYTSVLANLASDDSRRLALQWLEEDIEFTDIQEGSSVYAQKIYYIFSNRLKLMMDTICMSREVDDLKEISDLEGYMSEISIDYCMMLMFFEVPDIFPINTHVFNWWNCNLDYSRMKEHFQESYMYTDCNIMEDQAYNKDYKFIIPYFQGVHFRVIVRRWIDDVLYFFYNDSNYKTERKVNSRSAQFVEYEVFGFLMNSPLWPNNTKARWVRVPSKTQEESECGFRTLLHAYILVVSRNPLTCLLPLNYIGAYVSKKTHPLHQVSKCSLPLCCRIWVKDMMYTKKWITTDWIKGVVDFQGGNTRTMIKSSYFLEMTCTTKYEDEVKSIVREERKAEADATKEDAATQLTLLLQKSIPSNSANTAQIDTQQVTINSILLSSSYHNKEHVSDVEQFVPSVLVDSISVMRVHDDSQQVDLQRVNSNELDDTKSNSTNASRYSVEAKRTKIFTPSSITNQDDELLRDNTARENEESLEGNDNISNLQDGHVTDYGSSVESRSESTCSGSYMIAPWRGYKENNEISDEDSASTPKHSEEVIREFSSIKRVVIRTSNTSLTRVMCGSDEEKNDSQVHNVVCNEVGDSICNDEPHDTELIVPSEYQPPLPDSFVIRRERKSKNTCNATMYIDDNCPICSRPVITTYVCVKCSLSIHNVCGFMQPGGNIVCIHCYNTSSNTDDPFSSVVSTRRLRQEITKDAELSNLWSVSKFRKSKNANDLSTRLTKLPPLSREQKTKIFNTWLTEISYLMCKPLKNKDYKFYGCHYNFQNVLEIHSPYLIDTLFENEEVLLNQLCNEDNNNKWCQIPEVLQDLFRARGECFSNDFRFINYDKAEMHQWSFMKFSTYGGRAPTSNCRFVDLEEKFKPGTYHISLATSSKSIFVNYVPKYYLLRWQRFCDKFKNTNQINDYDNLLHKARSNANRWVRMDAGRYRNIIEDDRDKYQLTCLPRNYKMQGIGESTCVFSSLISALHYIHDYHGRDLLVDKLHKSVDYSQMSIECTMNRENYAAKLLNEKGNYKVNTLKSYDVLRNQSMWPTLCILKGSDECVTHAVTVINDYIFDTSRSTALVLCKKNLDWCCGSDYGNTTFHSVVVAYRFIKHRGPSNIFVRNTDDVDKAIRSVTHLFMWLKDQGICKSLENYRLNYKAGEDFFSTMVDIMRKKPNSYVTRKLRNITLIDLFSSGHVQPMLLLLCNNYRSYRVITACDGYFFDGSKNPRIELTESTLKSVLKWENASIDDISVVKGIAISKKHNNIN